MDCERLVVKKGKKKPESCGHPLAVHDPCSVEGCGCVGYEPADRKARAALITDIAGFGPGESIPTLDQLRAREQLLGARIVQ